MGLAAGVWDGSGQTWDGGVGVVVVLSLSHVQLYVTLWTVARQSPLSMGFSRQESGVDCHSLLQRIFLTQGLNPGLLHCRQILYHLSYREDPG